MIKSSTNATDWLIFDSSRNPYNVTNLNLRADTSDAESSQTANTLNLLSNGFQITGTSAGSLNNSGTYIYAAFASNPFKYANAF
jgi:hypothetical protein